MKNSSKRMSEPEENEDKYTATSTNHSNTSKLKKEFDRFHSRFPNDFAVYFPRELFLSLYLVHSSPSDKQLVDPFYRTIEREIRFDVINSLTPLQTKSDRTENY